MEGKSERRTRKIRGVMKNGDQSETVNRSYFCVKKRQWKGRSDERIITGNLYDYLAYSLGIYCLAVETAEKEQGCKQ
jgi:hypothetical protein